MKSYPADNNPSSTIELVGLPPTSKKQAYRKPLVEVRFALLLAGNKSLAKIQRVLTSSILNAFRNLLNSAMLHERPGKAQNQNPRQQQPNRHLRNRLNSPTKAFGQILPRTFSVAFSRVPPHSSSDSSLNFSSRWVMGVLGAMPASVLDRAAMAESMTSSKKIASA